MMKILMISTLIALSFAVGVAGKANAEPKIIGGGLICDTIEDAKLAIAAAAPVASCGTLKGTALAEVTYLHVFNHNKLRFLIARYDFVGETPWGNPEQYGFWGAPIPIPGEDT